MSVKDPGDLAARLGALSPAKQALLARKLAARSTERPELAHERIAARTDNGPAPLSYAQELLWLFEQMTPGTPAYNVPLVRRIRGAVDVRALEHAFSTVVARHESLRTKFVEIEGSPRQVVLPAEPVEIDHIDLRSRAADSREEEAERILREIAARPFDLAVSTTPRLVLITLEHDNTLFLMVNHHIVFDGAAAVVVLREAVAVYDATTSGRTAELPALPIQIADFATWERGEAGTARLNRALAYWRDELAGVEAAVEVRPDFARAPSAVGPGGRHTVVLSSDTRDTLHALAAAHESTLFMVLMAGFQTLLHRYSGQSDVVVGTAMGGRDRPETAMLVGYLANALAMRAKFDGDPPFAELLRQVRQRTLRALDYQHVAYEELVRELRPGLPPAEQVMFRSVLTVQDASVTVPRLGGLAFEPLGVDIGAPKFDIYVSAADIGHGIELVVDYRSDLYHAETITRLVAHFEHLLLSAAQNPASPVSKLALMSAGEHDLVTAGWNDTAASYPSGRVIQDLISEQAARTPHAEALISGADRLTYADLERKADTLAARLQELGVTPGAMVGVLAERTAETVVAILAILKAGGAYVPLDPAHPAERLDFIARDTEFRLLVGRRPVDTVLTRSARFVTLVAPDETPSVGFVGKPVDVSSAGLAYVIYTSGSTGTPKGVRVTHDNLMVSTWARVLRYEAPVGRYLMLSSFAFDSSVAGLFWTLLQGGALVVPVEGSHLDAAALSTLLREERITHLLAIPTFYQVLLGAATADDLRTLRVAMTGGDYCSQELIASHFRLAPQAGFYTEYGPTETTVWCSVMAIEPGAPVPERVTIGPPMPNYRMYILDVQGQPQPINVPGEIYIGGRGVSNGYLGRGDLNDALFLADPFNPAPAARMYRSGERGRWLANGEIEFLGRMDFQVKVRGYRVELKEIEVTLLEHPRVHQAAVVLRAERGGVIVGYVVPSAAGPADGAQLGTGDLGAELRAHLARHLPEYMVPSVIVTLDAMPVTSSGKFDRNSLPAPEFAAAADDEPPSGPVEELVASVWSQALQVEKIGRTTSFFEMGGHSLLVTRVVAALAKLLRVHLPIRAMFDAPTVAGLAAALVEREAAPGQMARIAQFVLKLKSQPTSNA